MKTGYTVSELLEACMIEINHGNGDKIVLISDDDEGNGFHTLYFGFDDTESTLKDCADMGLFHDGNNPDDVILLG